VRRKDFGVWAICIPPPREVYSYLANGWNVHGAVIATLWLRFSPGAARY